MVLWAIVGGYVAQRIIEGLFIKRFDGMEIHVWRPIDSKFRLITARRNPNMVILVASLLFRRPDIGLSSSPGGRLASLIFHAVRLAQASEQRGARREDRLLARRMSWTAIVLAGSRPGRDAFAEQFGTDLKALIPVGRRADGATAGARAPRRATVVDRVIVLSQAPERIAAVLPEDARIEFRESQRDDRRDDAGALLDDPDCNGRCWSRPPTMRCSTRDDRRVLPRCRGARPRDRRGRARVPCCAACRDRSAPG